MQDLLVLQGMTEQFTQQLMQLMGRRSMCSGKYKWKIIKATYRSSEGSKGCSISIGLLLCNFSGQGCSITAVSPSRQERMRFEVGVRENQLRITGKQNMQLIMAIATVGRGSCNTARRGATRLHTDECIQSNRVLGNTYDSFLFTGSPPFPSLFAMSSLRLRALSRSISRLLPRDIYIECMVFKSVPRKNPCQISRCHPQSPYLLIHDEHPTSGEWR